MFCLQTGRKIWTNWQKIQPLSLQTMEDFDPRKINTVCVFIMPFPTIGVEGGDERGWEGGGGGVGLSCTCMNPCLPTCGKTYGDIFSHTYTFLAQSPRPQAQWPRLVAKKANDLATNFKINALNLLVVVSCVPCVDLEPLQSVNTTGNFYN